MSDDERTTAKGERATDEAAEDKTPKDESAAATTPDASSAPSPARRTNAAASAASRARRIGGARSPSNRTDASGAADDATATGSSSTGDGGGDTAETGSTKVSTAKSGTAKAESSKSGTAKAERSKAGSSKAGSSKPATAKPGTVSARSLAAESTAPRSDTVVITQAPPWLRWVPAAVLSVCAIAMLVVLLVAASGTWYSKPSASAARDRVLAAAKTCTAATNTYSYNSIAQDERKGLACSTGNWADQYRTAIKTLVTPTATKLKASQSVQINGAGIQSISDSGTQWTVLVYGQTKITQAKTKPRQDPFSAVVTMDQVRGKWLISNIDTVVKPNS